MQAVSSKNFHILKFHIYSLVKKYSKKHGNIKEKRIVIESDNSYQLFDNNSVGNLFEWIFFIDFVIE